jgi:hypothetical protein
MTTALILDAFAKVRQLVGDEFQISITLSPQRNTLTVTLVAPERTHQLSRGWSMFELDCARPDFDMLEKGLISLGRGMKEVVVV